MASQNVSVGRIVHFVLPAYEPSNVKSHAVGQHRPAVVVRVWPDPDDSGGPYADEAKKGEHVVQLQAFTDGSNDTVDGAMTIRGTSVHYDPNGAPGTWHWPERT